MAVMSQIARINPRCESFFAAVYEGISQNIRVTDWLLRNVLTSCSASAATAGTDVAAATETGAVVPTLGERHSIR